MALTHTKTKERAELIALSIGEIQLDPCTLRGYYASTLVDVLLTDDKLKELEEALLAEFRANALELLETEVF